MKQNIIQIIHDSPTQLVSNDELPSIEWNTPQVTRPKEASHGDWSTNIALVLAKVAKTNPQLIADKLITLMSERPEFSKIEKAGPGFINFFLAGNPQIEVIQTILSQQTNYGRSTKDADEKVHIEYVSANPTGPLHVGHGRGAAYGASLTNIMKAAGYQVYSEYYINDAGRQMNILAVSVWLRYLNLCTPNDRPFPNKIYQGDYVITIAEQLKNQHKDALFIEDAALEEQLQSSGWNDADEETRVDLLITACQSMLGERFSLVFGLGLDNILSDIKQDLAQFHVTYDEWFSEKSIADQIPTVVKKLQDNGHIYEEKRALWFRSTTFGDDKDRVVIRDNGQPTYFASDIAYHYNKYQRGYDKIVNIWGSDHHGYVARVKAALTALELDPDKLAVQLVQFAILYRGEERVPMSTRSGSFVTLRELRDEVGNDATRFFYVTRKVEQHMDFDLELAKSQSKDNPIYYIQYAHARICSVFEKIAEKGFTWDQATALTHIELLTEERELELLAKMAEYPEVIERSAQLCEPHGLAHYLRDLASDFHSYYNSTIVLVDDAAQRNARLCLSLAAKQVIANGLALLGVSAPEKM